MKIAVIGMGYVGLVTAVGLAESGHSVIGIDINFEKLSRLRKGDPPIYEEGLAGLLNISLTNGRLRFSSRLSESLLECEIFFIAVGTPSDSEGKADLTFVNKAVNEIAALANRPIIIVMKSTVPPGTGRWIQNQLRKISKVRISYVSCPEFLREGTAIFDYFHPSRIIIGSDDSKIAEQVSEIWDEVECEKVVTDIESAEMIKYAANAFLATKISFINEIANLCERVGAQVDDVAKGIGLDPRISPQFLKAGIGWGGSCFPKDVRALQQVANGYATNLQILSAVISINQNQRLVIIQKLKKYLNDLRGKTIAVLGLTFKPNTDDVRESAALDIIRLLMKNGANPRAYDPMGGENAKKEILSLLVCKSAASALNRVHACVLVTEWSEFYHIPWNEMKKNFIARPIVIDGRNMLDHKEMSAMGYIIDGIGRPNGGVSASSLKIIHSTP